MKEIKKKNSDDLAKLLVEKREEVRSFRFGIAGAGKKNVKAHSAARKVIAQILTESNLRKREATEVTS